ncbi:MAG: CDP-glucose 4,6-dehydratase [Actinobacteria bacterium]|nr:CDP-glucose 4,6-dehydratase [Actinomycetota bacterium]
MDLALGRRLRELPGPILLTGHTGFKGTWLTIMLERLSVPVVGLSLAPLENSLFSRADREGKIQEIFTDICGYPQVEKFVFETQPSLIIHMAAQPLVMGSYKAPRETFATNVMGTVNILNCAFACDSVEAVGVVTTDKVYRNDDSGRAFVESDPLAGKDPYSASKVGAEAAVAAWQHIRKISGGPRVISLRAGNVIGGGDWAEDRLLPDLVKGFWEGKQVDVRNPESTRPWQHVLDPLRGYLMTLECALAGTDVDAINFGPSDASLKVQEVVKVAQNAWPTPTTVAFSESDSKFASEAVSLQLDSNRAHTLLGWDMKWSQSEAVTATIDWWDKVLNNGMHPHEACIQDIESALVY